MPTDLRHQKGMHGRLLLVMIGFVVERKGREGEIYERRVTVECCGCEDLMKAPRQDRNEQDYGPWPPCERQAGGGRTMFGCLRLRYILLWIDKRLLHHGRFAAHNAGNLNAHLRAQR